MVTALRVLERLQFRDLHTAKAAEWGGVVGAKSKPARVGLASRLFWL